MSVISPPQTRRRRRWPVVLAIIVLLLIVMVAIHLFTRKAPQRMSLAQVVTVAEVRTGDMPETLAALGTVTPEATVTVLPQLSGFLTEVGYQEGQTVQKGQFLAQIDPRQYQIGKQQAEAQLARDQATLDQARADLARYTQLHN
ncbi:MAG TPA: biotin/lipoyl-binding protein, partial [Bordetella sp.]